MIIQIWLKRQVGRKKYIFSASKTIISITVTLGLSALHDAEIEYKNVDAVVASYCYGEPTCGQRASYELGLTGKAPYIF